MSVQMWYRLIIPITLLAVISVSMHFYKEADGFFLNLSTELIGIVITIAYVDWVLQKHEQRTWATAHALIAQRVEVFLNALVSGIRGGFGFGPDILDERITSTMDRRLIHQEVMRIGREVLAPSAKGRLDSLDQKGWARLVRHLNSASEQAGTLLVSFGSKLSSAQYSDLLELQDAIREALTFYSIFPDLAGVPDDELPNSKTPPEILKREGYDSTAEGIRRIIIIACRLGMTT